MICVTGAGGTVGREVVQQLQALGVPFRAVYFSPASIEAARARGVTGEAVRCDYHDPRTVRAALTGCDTLFLLGPNLIEQTQLETDVVAEASAAGIRHIVKQSVMGAADTAFSLGAVHRPVEQAIEQCGLSYTFLRPNSFMQNVVTFMKPTIQAESLFYSACDTARISHVDVRDLAAVAVQALTARDQHRQRAYTLTGPEAFSYDEMAAALSSALGRPIAHVALPPEDLRGGMLAEGMPEPLADRMLDLERYFREDRASGVTDDIQRVTGRAPRRFADYLRDHAALLQPVA